MESRVYLYAGCIHVGCYVEVKADICKLFIFSNAAYSQQRRDDHRCGEHSKFKCR